MTKYDELPALIKALKDIGVHNNNEKFEEFKNTVIKLRQDLEDKDTELQKLRSKLDNNMGKSIMITAAAAVGGYVIGK